MLFSYEQHLQSIHKLWSCGTIAPVNSALKNHLVCILVILSSLYSVGFSFFLFFCECSTSSNAVKNRTTGVRWNCVECPQMDSAIMALDLWLEYWLTAIQLNVIFDGKKSLELKYSPAWSWHGRWKARPQWRTPCCGPGVRDLHTDPHLCPAWFCIWWSGQC